MSDDFPTREQHERIANLAIEHGSVDVKPDAERKLVTVMAGHERLLVILDENGGDVTAEHAPAPTVYVEFPIDLVRLLLGDSLVDEALALCPAANATRRFALARYLGEPFVQAVLGLACEPTGA